MVGYTLVSSSSFLFINSAQNSNVVKYTFDSSSSFLSINNAQNSNIETTIIRSATKKERNAFQYPREVFLGNMNPYTKIHSNLIETVDKYDENNSTDKKYSISSKSKKYSLVEGGCDSNEHSFDHTLYPTCNNFHEIDMIDGLKRSRVGFLGAGGVRDVWTISYFPENNSVGHTEGTSDSFVLKTLRWNKEFTPKYFKMHGVDAFASEHLTFSQYVVDIFGFCGNSVLNEKAQSTLKYIYHKSMSEKKLIEYARQAARGLADAHNVMGEENFTIVHRDITPNNFVISKEGTIKINDFNAGKILPWNKKKRDFPCGFRHQDCTQYRSPEECMNSYNMNQKVDVYAFGHVLLYLLTGKMPYGKLSKLTLHDKIVKKRELPTENILVQALQNPFSSAFTRIIEKCYTFDKNERPESIDIFNHLNRVKFE